ncbi:hypothetical protein [Halobaculum lipolyticum]|uniref:Uncharacterized protein n=1 Tax=Halobaculum lipolyticum TaxID=3032001 RepID=A0ABD5W5I7_9EURY|nr:hypothetical protein [Halobaculum sp. DT31]
MNHDRIHAREPTHDRDRWSVGRIESTAERDGHAVVTVRDVDTGAVAELTVTLAVRDLFVSRLDAGGDSPVGERVWYRERGG